MYLLLEQDASYKTCMFLCVENCEISSLFFKKKKIFCLKNVVILVIKMSLKM